MKFYPAGRRGDRLPAVLGTPTFDETHPDGAHPRQLVNSFKALANRLREQSGKLLIIENLQIAT